jgi:Domain of unknown function (DU1801)
MAKYELKTTATPVGVEEFIGTVADEQQRVDAYQITALMERLSGHPPKMWGPSIIGFGQYHYKYASGHEGDMARISFSPRKGRTVLYIAGGFIGHAELMAKLGKHKTGKSCLYIKRLGDVDEMVLEQLCKASLKYMAQEYPE